MSNTGKKVLNIAIIGGGITGASAAQHLINSQVGIEDSEMNVNVHLFDQGRRGVGGRSSHRHVHASELSTPSSLPSSSSSGLDSNDISTTKNRGAQMGWDHGCQFFRADTERFRSIVEDWIATGLVKEWKGKFTSSGSGNGIHECNSNSNSNINDNDSKFDFFGMPSKPPFYVGANGMQSISKGILAQAMQTTNTNARTIQNNSKISKSKLQIFTGTRVAQLDRDEATNKWKLVGTTGTAAFHDTTEKAMKKSLNANGGQHYLGAAEGYDAIILTDVSSSFGKWHRASAGVPESFASRVRERVNARVPLFTTMVAFENESGIPFDAATFMNNRTIWFASNSNSKPGMKMKLDEHEHEHGHKHEHEHEHGHLTKECWTLVSTPEYAMEKIAETPMQDPKTGEFIPQSKEYLTTVPGPELTAAFSNEVTSTAGFLGKDALSSLPQIIHMDAQRWGSALPCHRHLDESSITREVISGVPYDSGRSSLAPTKKEICRDEDENTFLMDEGLMLIQAGDMMSTFTPGFESAAISGMDAAEYLMEKLILRKL